MFFSLSEIEQHTMHQHCTPEHHALYLKHTQLVQSYPRSKTYSIPHFNLAVIA